MTPPQQRRRSAPSMADVAARAGVSHQTVSRVLNAPHLVTTTTRERVERAIAELGFRRNSAARALVTRTTMLLGLVTPGEARFGPTSMTVALEQAARLHGYGTVLTVVGDADPGDVESALNHFLDVNVDGIVVVAPTQPVLHAAEALAQRLPVVAVTSAPPPGPGLACVGVDQQAGARLVAAHLCDLGHRDLLHLCGPPSWFDAQQRAIGWRDELARRGISGREMGGSWDAAEGYAATRQLSGNRLPSALFASNDLLAMGALRAFAETGVDVPEDVSLAGFDDIAGMDYLVPGLTTVRQPFDQVGVRAIEMLIAIMRGDPVSQELISPTLRVRGSTAAPSHARSH